MGDLLGRPAVARLRVHRRRGRGGGPWQGSIEVDAVPAGDGLFRVSVPSRTRRPSRPRERDDPCRRPAAFARLGPRHPRAPRRRVRLVDRPGGRFREASAGCRNVGLWPVLVGEEGSRSAMLAAPIILYDYPRVAPESHGDLFDATEIDEILTLRILTLTDAEKAEMAASDAARPGPAPADRGAGRGRRLLGLHGAMRPLDAVARRPRDPPAPAGGPTPST